MNTPLFVTTLPENTARSCNVCYIAAMDIPLPHIQRCVNCKEAAATRGLYCAECHNAYRRIQVALREHACKTCGHALPIKQPLNLTPAGVAMFHRLKKKSS